MMYFLIILLLNAFGVSAHEGEMYRIQPASDDQETSHFEKNSKMREYVALLYKVTNVAELLELLDTVDNLHRNHHTEENIVAYG